jgi:hypothetical protein
MKLFALLAALICFDIAICANLTLATSPKGDSNSAKSPDVIRQFSQEDVQGIIAWLKSEALKPYEKKKAKGEVLTAAEKKEQQKIEETYNLSFFRTRAMNPNPPYSRRDVETFQASATDQVKPTKAKSGGLSIKIRESYSDLLPGEDPTVTPTKGNPNAAKKVTDLKGASLTYTRDISHGNYVWAGKAALLLPYAFPDFGNDLSKPFSLETAGIVPSVSLTKISSTNPATKNVDSLVYRAGAFATLYGPNQTVPEILFRGWATYATDTHNDSGIVAGEFDIEPRLLFGNSAAAIGYKRWVPLPGKSPGSLELDATTGEDKTKDWEAFNYQCRAYLHGEFGSVTSTGANPSLVKGGFFRMGPALELKLGTPYIPRLNLTMSYRYLPAISGAGDYYYFEGDVDYALYMNAQGQRISLKGSYINGYIDLTSQRAETLLLGLGVTF